MRLTWNEIRARAAAFADEFADATRESAETQSFYNAFFQVFGVKRRSVGVYERRVEKLEGNPGYIDLFWPQVLIVEQKSTGRDLNAARVQAEDYFLALKEAERPRYILACDFQTFDLYDLSERTKFSFKLADLPDHVERFGFIMGVQKVAFKDQDPVNITAAELVGTLHDQLEESGFTGTDLEKFLVRIVFCLFADDTGVFQPRNLFLDWLEERTADDGSDLGPKLAHLFQVLDTPENQRGANLDEDLAAFPYVNGDLFAGATRIPEFNAPMREALLTACRFDWSPISPAIFGSLFQSVMLPAERRATGAHYTTEKNILKVIGPLFLDGLRAEFERAKTLKRGRRQAMEALQAKMGGLDFFDPACGCGNFLIIAYRELRRLEIELLRLRYPEKQLDLEVDILEFSAIDVDQFHGIEIGEFAVEIARAAMWMMDHIMNNELSRAFGLNFARIPLTKSANIVHGDALEVDWSDVIAPERCNYVLGNPPFVGQSFQSKFQREQMARIIDAKSGRAGSLDYVGAWFLKAGEFLNATDRPKGIAFVATNSITQGEQVAQLWPLLFERCGLEISFAHGTFAWGSDARGKAHVHVVIIGLVKRVDEPATKRLFSYTDINGEPEETGHAALSPYLFDASGLSDRHVVVREELKPINGAPDSRMGTKPVVGQHYLFADEEKADFIRLEPNSHDLFRPFIGSREYLRGQSRWILHLSDCAPEKLRTMPYVMERVRAVKALRANSTKGATRRLAETPTDYEVSTIPIEAFLVLPEVSSERRQYIPFGWLAPPVIPSNKLTVVLDATSWLLGLVSSAMHMAWVASIGGRLKSDYSYATGLIYNTFPWPDLTDKAKGTLTQTGQAILEARDAHPDATLADLYDPDAMPPNLRKAHRENDRAVDRLYRRRAFESERERVEFLFARYEQLRAPLIGKKKK